MVQKQITRKAPAYGLVGILAAIILIAMIYSYGIPQQSPLPSANGTPNPSVSPAASLPTPNPDVSPIQVFSSYDEIQTFLANNSNIKSYWRGAGESLGIAPTGVPAPIPSTAPLDASLVQGGSPSKTINVEYSGTNIQVAGVDEADTVKTDGYYIYLIANNTVYILDAAAANPEDAKVIAKIAKDDNSSAYLSGIYLSQDGNKLTVLGSHWMPYLEKESTDIAIEPFWGGSTVFVHVYNVSDKAVPTLVRNYTISGNYINSRMIGDYVYTIVTETVRTDNNGTYNVPVVFKGASASNVAASNILYVPSPSSYYTYTTVVALNVMDDVEVPTETSVMMDGSSSSNIYVSASNIYLVTPNWYGEDANTYIYRISINGTSITAQAKGAVVGNPINQYAMDEYNGYFRIATTTWIQDNATTSDGVVFKVSRQVNSIYVLDMDMNVVGKLERFKMDENLYAVRFMGDKCYVVTFEKIDPFFIIDMSNPAAPQVSGELKIPGYSTYLHPLDENHIIGLGEENNTLKLSLFDVSNVNSPTEIAKYIVDARYADSTALYDPHAFLFDAQKQMLAIPVSINDMPIIMPLLPTDAEGTASSSKLQYWQGAFIFDVSVDGGFVLKGAVTQFENLTASSIDPVSPIRSDYVQIDYNHYINRALYIDNVLYTFSQSRVQLNSLSDFSLLAKIDLS
ncbi:MAG: beta-propeller domain-containing protein [Candidatus Bathyarchaeota archaeon]|nr:beta-propeller domain-containing protein [Candidatus Bathyarchaeota archaeon]